MQINFQKLFSHSPRKADLEKPHGGPESAAFREELQALGWAEKELPNRRNRDKRKVKLSDQRQKIKKYAFIHP